MRLLPELLTSRWRLACGITLMGVAVGFASAFTGPAQRIGAQLPVVEPLFFLKRNLGAGALLILGGTLAGSPTAVALLFNGFAIGAVASSLAFAASPRVSLAAIFPHGVLEIPGLLLFGAAGFGIAASMLQLFDASIRAPTRERLLTETIGATLLVGAAAPIEATVTPRILRGTLLNSPSAAATTMVDPSWLLVLLVIAVPCIASIAIARRLARKDPVRGRRLSTFFVLVAPFFSIAASTATVVIQADWIQRHVELAKVNGLASPEAFPVWAAIAVPAAVVYVAFFASSRMLRRHGPQPVYPSRHHRYISAGVVLGVLAVIYLASLLLRTQFRMSPQAAGMVGLAVAVSLLMSVGPMLLRITMPTVQDSRWDEHLRSARSFLRDRGIDSRRLGVVRPQNQEWANALAIGALPGLSRVAISERLLEILSPDEITAITAHEVGHIRRNHVAKLLVAQVIVVMIASPLFQYASSYLSNLNTPWASLGFVALGVSFSCLFLPIALGSLSRRFEREADAYAAAEGFAASLATALQRLSEANRLPEVASVSWIERLVMFHPTPQSRISTLQRTSPTPTPSLHSA